MAESNFRPSRPTMTNMRAGNLSAQMAVTPGSVHRYIGFKGLPIYEPSSPNRDNQPLDGLSLVYLLRLRGVASASPDTQLLLRRKKAQKKSYTGIFPETEFPK
eukprot:6462864-Amphidinium_carterae.1